MWWMTIEVFHGEFPAARWRSAHEDALVGTAVGHGLRYWEWHEHRWGVVLELCFGDERDWDAYRASLPVRAALDAVPDPVNGLLVYRGRGGGAGAGCPRRPRPSAGAGALALPLPADDAPDGTGTPLPLLAVGG